jgi:hypothetical protein
MQIKNLSNCPTLHGTPHVLWTLRAFSSPPPISFPVALDPYRKKQFLLQVLLTANADNFYSDVINQIYITFSKYIH